MHRSVIGAGFTGQLSGGVVVTGGGAEMPGVVELAADVFGAGVRIGAPGTSLLGLSEAAEGPRFATVVGLALYGAHRIALGGATTGGAKRLQLASPGVDKLAHRIKVWLQDFF